MRETCATLLTVLCALSALLTVIAVARARPLARTVLKLTASACFVTVGALLVPAWTAAAALVFAGLSLGAVGDACLLGDGARALRWGMLSFGAGHATYLAAALMKGSTTARAFGSTWIPAAALCVSVLMLSKLWPRAGSLRVFVAGYIVLITVMLAAAVGLGGMPTPFRIGAALFYVSDLFVARQRFIHPSLANRAVGLPIYYAAQLCIAWSLASSW